MLRPNHNILRPKLKDWEQYIQLANMEYMPRKQREQMYSNLQIDNKFLYLYQKNLKKLSKKRILRVYLSKKLMWKNKRYVIALLEMPYS